MIQYFNILPENFAKSLYQLGADVLEGKCQEKFKFWTNKMWDPDIVEESAPVVCFNLDGDRLNMVQSILEAKGVYNPETDLPLQEAGGAMIYLWTKGSYIPVHSDGTYAKAMTIYLNEDWSFNDGGMFNWYEQSQNEWKAVLPSFNMGMLNDTLQLHGTSMVTSRDKTRITLQVFYRLKKEKVQ
jgi:hypothetical protein